jgi:hypothetical protein
VELSTITLRSNVDGVVGNADDQILASAMWNQGSPIDGPAYISRSREVPPVTMAVSVFILAQSARFRTQKLTPWYSLVSG